MSLRDPLRRSGFTLIEVVGALVIFAAGVLLTLHLTGALAAQMEASALRSEVVGLAQERMEELQRLPYDSLSAASESENLTVRGVEYTRTVTVSDFYPRTYSLEVVVQPTATGSAPTHALVSYTSKSW